MPQDECEDQLNTTLDTVIIFTERMHALAEFYADVLCIGPFESSPGHLGTQVGAVYFGFDQVEAVGGETPRQGVTLWFEVDDLESAFQCAVEMGAEVRYPPTTKPWGAVLASVHDPDGNILGLSQRRGS